MIGMAVHYVPFDPQTLTDPYPAYDRLRVESPIHWEDTLDRWILTRYADVAACLRDPRLSARRPASDLSLATPAVRAALEELARHFSGWLLLADPPDHTRLRGLVSGAFTPRMLESFRPRVRALVDRLVDPLVSRGEAELMGELADPLPMMVIAEVLGLPLEDCPQLNRWCDDLTVVLGGGRAAPDRLERPSRAVESLHALLAYLRAALRRARAQPGDDLLSVLLVAEQRGDVRDDDELLGICTLLLTAGTETSTNLIANGLLGLLRHPDRLAELRDDPSLAPQAIEELLRYDTPGQWAARSALQDLVLDGMHIRRGNSLLLGLGAANRDPARFDDPGRLDLRREDTHHLAFGFGLHFCVGAPFARLESQIALNEVLRRLPGLRLASDTVEWRPNPILRGLRALPVRFSPG